MDGLEVSKYTRLIQKRKWWVIIPFLVTCLGGLAYGLVTPKIYEAQTLILVQSQRVPEDYVRSIVSEGVNERLKTISQQVMSRTNLENLMKEYKLYSEKKGLLVEEKLEIFRQSIKIDVSEPDKRVRNAQPNAFTIAFQSESPKKAMDVANALASNFIAENLRIRESQAMGTSTFLADELENVRRRLLEKEADLKNYREKFMGGLPEQLATNLKILERLQAQNDQLQHNLRDAENRYLILQKEGSELATTREPVPSLPTKGGEGRRDLATLKSDLVALEAKYTPNHPDVIRLKETIAKLEEARGEAPASGEQPQQAPTTQRIDPTIKRQMDNVEAEIRTIRSEIARVSSEIKSYAVKVEDTPKREQELLTLNRDYNNLKELHDSLLKRKLEAEIAVSMEKKQQGEQFRVIDPAKEPQLPVKPDIKKLILLTLVIGLGLGGGLAYLQEMMDSSFKAPDELEKELKIPVILTMPMRYTEKEIAHQNRTRILAGVSVGVGFVACAVGILLVAKGLDTTLAYVKNLLGRV